MTDAKPHIDRTVTVYKDYAKWTAHIDEGDEIVLRWECGDERDPQSWSGPDKEEIPWLTLAEAEAFAREIIELVRFARETA